MKHLFALRSVSMLCLIDERISTNVIELISGKLASDKKKNYLASHDRSFGARSIHTIIEQHGNYHQMLNILDCVYRNPYHLRQSDLYE